jgi:DNA repair protein RadA/Sms
MVKIITKYVCQSCGYISPRWAGKCPNCDGWNTFAEEAPAPVKVARKSGNIPSKITPVKLGEVDSIADRRIKTGIAEFDRVLGGGIVSGAVVLLGGDPGIGKSTLMMQVALKLKSSAVLYVTGEESLQQIKMRADRLSPGADSLLLLPETNMEIISEVIERQTPDLMVIDSIQTMYRPDLESAPGSVGQVRETTALLTRMAKAKNFPIFLVGHVTKEGMIAGPRVIEHMVDTVLQFEGERQYAYRVLRAAKNRFGSTNEIGIFEMHETGMQEVKNPSEMFLSQRTYGSSGSSIVASIEGTRPILIEVQALVTTTSYGLPQRTATGFDLRRLQMLLAVLEKRSGMNLGNQDVFVNVAGGIRIEEPAADLGVAVSIVSSLRDIPVDTTAVAIGEVGLGGEIRTVSHCEKRIQEAAKLGFKRVVVPQNNMKNLKRVSGIEIVGVESVQKAIKLLVG